MPFHSRDHTTHSPTLRFQVRRCFLEESRRRFRHVELIPQSAIPEPLRLEYVDIWQLQL